MSAGFKDSQLCFDLGTIPSVDLETQLNIAKRTGWQAVGITTEGLESFLAAGKTIEEAKALLDKSNLKAVELMAFREWIYAKGKAQKEMLDRFRDFSKMGAKLGGPILLVTTRTVEKHDDALARENLKEICRLAAETGGRVGFEYVPHSNINTVGKAWDILKTTDAPNAGIVLDFFHYLKGPSRLEDLRKIPIEKVLDVHLNDLKDIDYGVELGVISRNHRVFPGEGDFVFDEMLGYLFERNYSGYYSLEILNKDHASQDPVQLAVRGKESAKKVLSDFAQKWSRKA